MDEELNDLHQLSTVVFTNIGTITPSIKNLIANAKTFYKSYQGTVNLGTQFIQSLDAFAQSALEAKGSTHAVGETLKDIIDIFCEIEAMKGDLINIFMNEVIVPLDNRAEQEVGMSKLAYRQYLQDNKIQTEVVAKLTQEIIKLRKKSQKKKGKTGKYEKREEELLEEFQNEERNLRGLREQGLRRALIGERRVYCFVADRICNFGRGMAVHSNRVASMLNQKLDVWNKVVSNPSELPTESEQIIMNPSMHYTATMRKKKQAMTSSTKASTLDSSLSPLRPSVVGKESFETIPENGAVVNGGVHHEIKGDPVKELTEPREINTDTNAAHTKPKNMNGYARFSMISDTVNHNEVAVSSDTAPQLRALYSHIGKDNSQLSFSKGDLLLKLGEPTGGWQYGKHQISERCGWFPATYVEVEDPIPSPMLVITGPHSVPIPYSPPSPKNSPTRRFSTPSSSSSSSPYIPAPDYDDCHENHPFMRNGERTVSQGSRELHLSMSEPRLTPSRDQKTTVNFVETPPEIIPPPAFGDNFPAEAPIQQNGEQPEISVTAMPFPPPPPSLIIDEPELRDDNPFAGIILKKAITNDRSVPYITQ